MNNVKIPCDFNQLKSVSDIYFQATGVKIEPGLA